MKESSTDIAPRRNIFLEISKASLVVVSLILLMTLGLAIAGQFRIETSGGYGVYNSALSPEAALNPLWKLIADTQLVALMILPLPLFVFKRRLGVAVVPWVLVALFTVIGATTRLYYPPLYDSFDPSLDSKLWLLLRANIFIGISILVSYFAYLSYKNRHGTRLRYKGFLTKRNILIAGILLVLGAGLLFYALRPVQVCNSSYVKGQTVKSCWLVRRFRIR